MSEPLTREELIELLDIGKDMGSFDLRILSHDQALRAEVERLKEQLKIATCGEALCGHDHSTQYWENRANKAEQEVARLEIEYNSMVHSRDEWRASCHQVEHERDKFKDLEADAVLAYNNEAEKRITLSRLLAASQARVKRLEEAIRSLRDALNAQLTMRDMKSPRKLDEALTWRQNDSLAAAKADRAFQVADQALAGEHD